MTQCVYCDKTSDLNTSLTITLEDGNRVSVDICDEHAEDATVKTAREAYVNKQKQIEDVIAQARALGLEVGPTTQGGLVTVQQTPAPAQAPVPAKPQQREINDDDLGSDEDVVDTSLIDSRPGMMSVGGNTEMGSVASHASFSVNGQQDILPEDARKGKARMRLVEGRGGQPLAIPEKRVDGTGTTKIKVANIENDQKLQTRFKRMADDSLNDKVPNFARSGYQNTTVNCPFCRGQGEVNQGGGKKIECPKCEGAGLISTY